MGGSTRVIQISPDLHIESLTPAQNRVAGLMLMDYDVRSIARELGITLRTASYHMTSIRARLGLTRRSSGEVKRTIMELALNSECVDLPDGLILIKLVVCNENSGSSDAPAD